MLTAMHKLEEVQFVVRYQINVIVGLLISHSAASVPRSVELSEEFHEL